MERRRIVSLCAAVALSLCGGVVFAAGDSAPPAISSAFSVQTGVVKDITVTGNERESTQGILATMRTKVGQPFSQATLDQDKATLFQLGVFKAPPSMTAIQNADGSYSIAVQVAENPVIKEIRVVGNTVFTQAQILAVVTMHPGDIFSDRAGRATSDAIHKLYADKGYRGEVVDLSYLPESPNTLNLEIQELTVSSVQVTGNTRTKKRVIDHLIKTRKGEAFSMPRWRKDLENLQNSGWFEKVEPHSDTTSIPGEVGLNVNVTENKSGNFGLGIQLDPQSSLAGFIRYNDTNYKGSGRSIGASVSEGTRGGGPSADIFYTDRFFDNRDTAFSVSIYSHLIYRFTDSLFGGSVLPNLSNTYYERRTGTSFSFSRPIGSDITASITSRIEAVSTSNVSTQNGNGFIQQDGYIGTVAFGLARDHRDNILDPSRGTYLTGSIEPGFSYVSEAGGLIANQSYLGYSGFVKVSGEFRSYYSPQKPRGIEDLNAPRRVFAFRLRAGSITGPIPFFEQYFVGGTDTPRGYDEDRFWGKDELLSTLEFRYPIQKSFNLITFVDYGGAWGGYGGINTFRQSSGFDMHIGYGVGVAFKAGPLGTIRLDLGVNDHGGTRTHFEIGPSF